MEEGALILVAEDHPFIQKNIEYLLQLDGYRVACADNGRIALEMAQKEIPSLIISDVMMPEMNGYEWISELYQIPAFERIPVMYLTALDSPDDRLKGLSHGAVDYIPKPFTAKELLLKVKNLLNIAPPSDKASPKNTFKENLDALLLKHLYHHLSTEEIADALNLSKSSLQRRAKENLDFSVADYQMHFKLNKAKTWLSEGNYQVNEISDLLGFSSPSHFISSYKKAFSITPKQHTKEL